MSKKKYGIYSFKAERSRGSLRYGKPGGGSVIVTCVSDTPEAAFYHWDDKRCVGEVTDYLGEGMPCPFWKRSVPNMLQAGDLTFRTLPPPKDRP